MITAGKAAPAAGRYAALTVVRDGDGYVLGSWHSTDFVAVPDIGGQVVLWLQDGATIAECGRRAAELAGQPVDVAGFLTGLTQAGLLTGADRPAAEQGQSTDIARWKRVAGRILLGRAGLTVQGLLAAVAVVAMIRAPQVRPTYTDALTTSVPLASILILAVLNPVLGMAHELAHVLAAWAAGVSSRVSVSRRMTFIVLQTDLTRLWSVPRRRRVVPLLAGMIFDAAAIGVLVVLELTVLGSAPPFVLHLVRAAVLLNIGGIAVQFLIFLRTDVYALFMLATGCKRLWDTKGAIARRAIGRATAEDLTLLDTVGSREISWARVFLCLYAPGVLLTAWYFGAFGLPATRNVIVTSVHAVSASGLASAAGAAGAVTLVLIVASTAFMLRSLAKALAGLFRQLMGA